MTISHPTSTPYPKYKIALLAMLTGNAAIYAFIDTWGSALDAVAWLVLLVLFEMETEFPAYVTSRGATATIHGFRSAAIAGATVATLSYLIDFAWIDMANSAIWVAIIVLLEWEMRYPHAVARHRRGFFIATGTLYAGLIVVAGLWAWTGEWFDAYDAVLWIAAYATIELDVFKFSQRAIADG